jgi:ppGpp synthetase/RelA/SpoT-type nucleotidyltranferase
MVRVHSPLRNEVEKVCMEKSMLQLKSGLTSFVASYEGLRWKYARLARLTAQFLEGKVADIFSGSSLPVLHMAAHRAKAPESLQRNIEADVYGAIGFEFVRDLAGVRLIFYFEDDLSAFCRERDRFRTWFGKFSAENLVHKSAADNGGLPGYDSFHFPVCVTGQTAFWRSLHPRDRKNASLGGLEGLYCEVQLRTILRHAWAEAEHDLRYKVKRLTPHLLRAETNKNFIHLAAVVEDTDKKLVGIKREMAEVLPLVLPSATSSRSPWHYSECRYKEALWIDGVSYHYELLHSSVSSSPVPFVLVEHPVLFDVDRMIEEELGVGRFKQAMWELLRTEEPRFMLAVTYDSTVVRVCSWEKDERRLHIQPARYSDQVVTNHTKTLAKQMPGIEARTIHDLAFDQSGLLLPFSESPMANTIGVSCVARIERRFWIASCRSSAVAFDPDMLGCTASGALEWTELGQWGSRDFETWFKGGIIRECEEEIGYVVERTSLHYLGFARELGRAGKPHIFFFVDIEDANIEDFESLFLTYRSPSSEHQRLRFFDDSEARFLVGTDSDNIQAVIGVNGLSEEFRTNLALALQFTSLQVSSARAYGSLDK